MKKTILNNNNNNINENNENNDIIYQLNLNKILIEQLQYLKM